MKTLYIDLDGTCFEFKKDASLDEIMERGFFSKLYPFPNVINGLKLFHEQNPDINLKILSACLDRDYIVEEKNQLVDKHLPFIEKKIESMSLMDREKANIWNQRTITIKPIFLMTTQTTCRMLKRIILKASS